MAGLTLVIWFFGATGEAYAQGNTWVGVGLTRMIEGARWRFGVLRVNAAFTLANAGYDSDIYYGYLGDPVPDFTLAASIPVQLLLPVGKKMAFEIYDNPEYVFYLDTDGERAWNNTFRGQVHFAMNRLYVLAGASLSNVRQRMSPELSINVRLKQERLNGTMLLQVSRSTSLALIYGGTEYDYGDAEFGGVRLAETQNRREGFLDLITYIQSNPRIRLFFNGQFGKYKFTETISAFRDAQSYGVFGGLDFVPGEAGSSRPGGMEGRIGLGYMRLDINDPERIDGSGFAGNASISIGFMEKTTGRVFFSRGYEFSIFSGSTFYISTSYGAGITRLLSRRASLSYDLSFGLSKYPEDGVVEGGLPAGTRNRYTTHIFNLSIMLARHLTIAFIGTLGKRVPDEFTQARNRNFFGFGLVYGSAISAMPTPSSAMAR